MKNRKTLMLIVLGLLLFSLLPMQTVSAEAEVTYCHVDLYMTGFQEGTVTYPGGNWHIRGRVIEQLRVSDIPYCSGPNTSVSNANWDADGFGPVWGTFHTEESAGADYEGGWDGSFTGSSGPEGMTLQIVGHGYGDLEGMQITGELNFPPGVPLQGEADNYILDPHGD